MRASPSSRKRPPFAADPEQQLTASKSRRVSSSSMRHQKTIDEQHRETVARFQKEDEVEIPRLEKQIQEMRRAHRALRPSQMSMVRNLEFNENIYRLRKEIDTIKKKQQLYYSQNAVHLFRYFEEKKNSTSVAASATTKRQSSAFILANLFGVQGAGDGDPPAAADAPGSSAARYWFNVKGEIPNVEDFIVPSNQCSACTSGLLFHQEEDGVMVCENKDCGAIGQCVLDSSKNLAGEATNEACSVQYERLSHFREILSQFQAKETTSISPEIMAVIRARIKKERITSLDQIDYDKMREMLSILKFNKLFGHIPYINSILGIKPPFMDDILHNTLCKLFVDIQQPWSFHCPPDRVKFFSYTYVLHQLCVLLGQTQYLPFIPGIKDAAKIHSMNLIWQKVCDHLDWEYTPM